MVLTTDQQRIRTLLTETVTLLCKNGLHFKSEFSIEGLIGITLDNNDVFLVSIKETVRTENKTQSMSIGNGLQTRSTVASDSNFSMLADDRTRPSQVTAGDRIEDRRPVAAQTGISNLSGSQHLTDNRSTQNVTRKRSSSTDKMPRSEHDTDSEHPSSSLCRPGEPGSGADKSQGEPRLSKNEDVDPDAPTPKRSLLLSPARSEAHTFRNSSGVSSITNKTAGDDFIEIKEEELSDSELESSVTSQNSFVPSYPTTYGQDGVNVSRQHSFDAEFGQYMDVLPGCSAWDASQGGVDSYADPQLQVELVPGSEVYVSSMVLRMLENEPRGSKIIRRLIHEMFPDERMLAASSCLGKRLAGGTAQCGLDQRKVDAIKEYVTHRCPDMTHSQFVQTVNIMCGDARKSIRSKIRRLYNSSFQRH